ncbi:alkaline-phosphatase-like protein [Phakopsora pachyrhizi]|uniref:Alkaline phosphatase n=1 Tax=Phakopsora pachyrhizi TaxID=170000 RepID=A0AAV0BHI7_PHAPC|nr:alkaline-phosphatase-like protein [Phakopsora pachyrhizi]
MRSVSNSLPLGRIEYSNRDDDQVDEDLEDLRLLHSNDQNQDINQQSTAINLSSEAKGSRNVDDCVIDYSEIPNNSNAATTNRNFNRHDDDDDDYKDDDDDEDIAYKDLDVSAEQLPQPTVQKSSRPSIHHQQPRHAKRVLLIGGATLVGLAYLIMFTATKGTRYDHSVKMNVILMISDGFGPASETFAREFVQKLRTMPPSERKKFDDRWSFFDDKGNLNSTLVAYDKLYGGGLPLDPLLIGSSRTRSSNSLITDSAAGATAFSCALKTYNGAIGVEPKEQKPCGTVLEAAKHRGYLTGLVATSRITHATPASFYAHVIDRDMETKIAKFLIGDGPLGRSVDLAFGGGRRFFTSKNATLITTMPASKTTKRRGPSDTNDDEKNEDLLEVARDRFKFDVLMSNKEFEDRWKGGSQTGGAQIKVPVLGLFNDDHMKFEIDRFNVINDTEKEPSLRNMSLAALQTLSRDAKSSSAHGFFLMIEGSRIDMAAHSNDPIGHLYDILAYQETVRTVKTWVDEANKAGWPTLMISVSDHETGGLTLGRQLDPKVYPTYAWYPETLLNSTGSVEHLTERIKNFKLDNHRSRVAKRQSTISSTGNTTDLTGLRKFVVDEIFKGGLGLNDFSGEELEMSLKLVEGNDYLNLSYHLANMISRRAQVGWTTHGHSGVDVNLYGYPTESVKDLIGSRENVEIGKFIVEVMSIDLEIVTRDLNRLAKVWHMTEDTKELEKYNELKHYSHEF